MLFEISKPNSDSEKFDWQAVLDSWDVAAEQRKADFMEDLYHMYGEPNGLYTGLWQAFKEDAARFIRDKWNLELVESDIDQK
jgi:hypothetical protein